MATTIDTPALLQSDRQQTASIRLQMPRADIQKEMGPAIQELMATIAAQGVVPAGPLISHHFRIDPAVFDFEVSIPVNLPVQASGRVVPSELPAALVARTNYRGPYEKLGDAWCEFQQWIKAQGHETAGGPWERYLKGPESGADAAQWLTELNQPIKRT
ncbi:MAG TPA: GyrI-like domain-containing protein [Moraxellaceae bacterium]